MNALAARGALTCPHSVYKVAGTRIRAVPEGFVDDFLQTRSVVDDLRSGRPTFGFSGAVLAHFHPRWPQLLGRSPSPPPAGVHEALGVAAGEWDAESVLPSWLGHGAPNGILEEVETAGVFPPCHGDEQPWISASLCTCLAAWSNCASAEEELEVDNQLLQAHADMGHCPFFDTLDELKSYFGVDHVVLSKLALFTKQDGSAKHRLTWNFFGLMSIPRYGVPHRADSGPSV